MSFIIPVDDALCMRLVEPQHAEEAFALIDADREHLRTWLNWVDQSRSVDDVRNYAKLSLQRFADRTALALHILEHNKIVGGTGWTDWQQWTLEQRNAEGHTADIGYWLASSAQGRGVMTRCVSKLVDLAFNQYGVHRLTIRAEPDNARSNALPRRLGFKLEGTMRHIARYDGRWIDHNLWALLAAETDNISG